MFSHAVTGACIRVSVLLLNCTPILLSQQTATLSGTVIDPSGAPISSALVEVQCKAVAFQSAMNTDNAGRFVFIALPPGNCEVTASAPGFQKRIQTVTLERRRMAALAIRLEIGAVSETITVTASAGTVMTSTASAQGRPSKVPGQGIRRRGINWNTEQYDHFLENEFASPRVQPLSTFSADVDTASYSNVRRMLRDGQLPPPGAVRIEEMINYFRYSQKPPVGDEPFAISTELADCPWNRSHSLLRIAIRTKPIATDRMPPSNLVFLIDVSGSMTPANKLPLVKQSMRLLVEQLREQDRVAIAVYAGAAGKVLDPTSGSQKQQILAAIESLQPGGSTNGAQGLRLAYQLARESMIPKGNNRVILATDGDFNVGVSSDDDLVRLIERERESGVSLSVLGFGMGNLKDSKMEKLADHGNGNYAYIDSLSEARKVLVEQMGGTLLTVAKDVKFQVEFNPAQVRSYRLIGYENRVLRPEEFNDDKKDAGDLGAGHQTTAFYEIVPLSASDASGDVDRLRYQEVRTNRRGADTAELCFVKVRYKPPQSDKSKLIRLPVAAMPSPFQDTSEDFRFSAAVVEASQLMRESKFRGKGSFEQAKRIAASAAGYDPGGYRAEFIELLDSAMRLSEVARK